LIRRDESASLREIQLHRASPFQSQQRTKLSVEFHRHAFAVHRVPCAEHVDAAIEGDFALFAKEQRVFRGEARLRRIDYAMERFDRL